MRQFVFVLALALALAIPSMAADDASGYTSAAGISTHGIGSTAGAMAGKPAGLSHWWDASDSSTITQASNAVSAWVDKIGGTSLGQASAGAKPTLVSAGSGVLSATQHLSLDGGDFLSIDSALSSGQSGEVWVTFELTSASGTFQVLYSEANNSTTAYNLCDAVGSVALKPAIGTVISSNNIRTTNAAVADATGYVGRFYSTSSAYGMDFNGTNFGLTAVTGSDNGNWYGDSINARSAVGCYYHNTNTQFVTGEVGQVLLFDGTQPVVTAAVLLTVLKMSAGL